MKNLKTVNYQNYHWFTFCHLTNYFITSGDANKTQKFYDIDWVHHVVRLLSVTVGWSINDELSQETTEMTNGALLISLQPYQAPCPRYKCHLSPRDWDRKPCRANCQAVINIDLEFYKNLFLYFEVWFLLFLGWGFSLLLALSLSLHLHVPTRACAYSTSTLIKCFHLWGPTLSLHCS